MQWFKHDSDSATDAKLRKLTIRHGAEGYAIYFHCLELISGDVSEHNLTFQLEHDSEIIADNLKIKGTADLSAIDRVNIIMKYIVELGLFQEADGRIFCLKMLKRLDLSMTSNKRFRDLITKAKENSNKQVVMTHHDTIMQEEKEKKEEKDIIENQDYLSSTQIHGIPEEQDNRFLTTYFKYYNQYYGLQKAPTDKDFQTIKELEVALDNDNEKFIQVVKMFFEKEYYFNRNKNTGKPAHYLKSLNTNLHIIVADSKGWKAKKENSFDSAAGFEQWQKDEAAGLHKKPEETKAPEKSFQELLKEQAK